MDFESEDEQEKATAVQMEEQADFEYNPKHCTKSIDATGHAVEILKHADKKLFGVSVGGSEHEEA